MMSCHFLLSRHHSTHENYDITKKILWRTPDYDAALEDALKTAIEDLVRVGSVVRVALRGRVPILKLRDISKKILGVDDADETVGMSKRLSNLLRSRTKWLVKGGAGNLVEVHIPADIPGLYATLTNLSTLTIERMT